MITTIERFKQADTVQKAIACMAEMPEPKPDEIPAIKFDANSSWLFGADFGVLRIEPKDEPSANALVNPNESGYVLTLQTVFNDPHLYALRIALAGDAAKIFKGLDFQIMYRKLSDNLGVYQSEITLPDIMRHLTVGAYSVTLPVFGIEIYTNGDFKVDIGFPWKEDFSRSFTVEAIVPPGIPLVGAGGIYFGKIPQVAAKNIPATTAKGHFNPILVLGFGAQLGLGKSIEYGLLKAGFSLTVFGIIEGLLAKWNPYKGSTTGSSSALQLQGEYYFWMRGTYGLIGKIYGSIDFSVVKAEVNITIKLYAQITFASYQPIPITVLASVDATASITINCGLFKIHLHFSFSVRIKETITIGALQNPKDAPWLEESQNNLGRLSAPLSARLRDHRLALMSAPLEQVTPVWSNLQKPQTPASLTGYLSFALTVAGDQAFETGQTPDKTKQAPCYIASLFIQSVPAATEGDDRSALKAAGNENDTSFETLAKLVTRWAIAAIKGNYTPDQIDKLVVTDDELKGLLDHLNDPQAISAADIEAFLSNQIQLTVSIPTEAGEVDAAFFPMALPLTLERSAYGNNPALNYSFAEYNAIASDFIKWLRDYFNQLAVQVKEESNNNSALMDLLEAGDISIANFVFTDYFVLIMRQMLQALREGLRTFKYPITLGDTGNKIVKWVNDSGDLNSLDNPFDLYDLFEGNAEHKLTAKCQLTLSEVAYTVQAGDSFDTIAAKNEIGTAFSATTLAIKNANTAGILANGQKITYPGKNDYTISGSSTLQSIADNVFTVSLNDLLKNSNILSGINLLAPYATLILPPFKYTVKQGDTLNAIAAAHGISIKELAEVPENGEVADLFATTDTNYLNLVHLPQFQVGELIKEAQRTKMLEHLSSMASRYYFHGLRLPTDKITPKHIGMWVSKDGQGNLSLPSTAGLFALTGQQMAIPSLQTESLTITVNRPDSLDWLLFNGDKQNKRLPYNIDNRSSDYKSIQALQQFATNNALETGLKSIGSEGMVESEPSIYPLSSSIPCQSTTSIEYPTGGAGDGQARLWYLPDAMQSLPRTKAPETDPGPSFELQVHRYDEATGATTNTAIQHYGWTTAIEFTIKRLPKGSAAYDNTYEIMGADGQAVVLLERIVQLIQNNDSAFAQLMLGYHPNTAETDNVLRAETDITMGISQVNLSTVTRPPASLMAEELAETPEKPKLLNTSSEFIRFLWEASITRAGGFYLYYHNDKVQSGLPDLIFNDKDEASVTLLALYNTAAQTNRLRSYMNAVLIGDPINLSTGAVVAQAVSSAITHTVEEGDTLDAIARRYYSTVLFLAQKNLNLEFAQGAQYTLSNGTYMVAVPGRKLADIATHFAMTDDQAAIKNANPRITSKIWSAGLSTNTPIRLPQVSRTVGTDPGGTTLQEIASFYGTSGAAIAGTNRSVTKLLKVGQNLTVATGPFMQSGTELPGVQAIGATRSPLPEMPDEIKEDDDSAKDYLLYLYTLLGYQVAQNQDFSGSNMGLPLGPKGKPASESMDKIRVAKPMNETDLLEYSKAVPYTHLICNANGQPETVTNPYQAIGRLLQIDYVWNDLYGNRLITDLDQTPKTPILTGYTDSLVGLSQWPSTSAHWTVANDTDKDSFLLTTTISFDPSPYNKESKSDAWKTRAKVALVTYERLLAQLTDPNGIAISFKTSLLTEPVEVLANQIGTLTSPSSTLVGWLGEIKDFLTNRAANGKTTIPEPSKKDITLNVKSAKTNLNDKQIFVLDFEFIIERTQGVAQGDFAAMPAVRKIATPVTPITTVAGQTDSKPGLDLFAQNIEDTLSVSGEYILTVGTGINRFKADAGGSVATVWAIKLGENQGINYSINDQGTPQIFAPRPVSNQLISEEATIHSYSKVDDFKVDDLDPTKNKLTGTSQTLNFTDIDLDNWIRQLFEAIDNLLSPEYVSAMLLIDKQKKTSFLESFKAQKKALANVAKNLMSPVYQTQETSRITSAQEALYQELLEKLSNLYSIRAAVSYSAKVNANIQETGQLSPQLYGNVVWKESSPLASQIVLTSPKLALQTEDDAALTFLVEAPAQVKSDTAGVLPALSLNLQFNGSNIEHQISALPGIEDYKASSWLAFVRPETAQKLQAELGQFQIPMFVRAFPLTPRMDVQTGTASNPQTKELSKLTLWNYAFTYSQDFHYAQDRVYGEIEYNLQENQNLLMADSEKAFQSIAQFINAKPNLEKLLKETVPEIKTTTTEPAKIEKAAKVLGAFLKIVSDVVAQTRPANTFAFQKPSRRLLGEPEQTYRFYIEENEQTITQDKQEIPAWVVKIVSKNGQPPQGLSDNPIVNIKGFYTIQESKNTDTSKGSYAYWYKAKTDDKPLTGDKAQEIEERTMEMPGLQVLQRQDAKATIYLRRNEELVTGQPSAKHFIYQTPKVTYSNPLHPTITSDQLVDIATIGSKPDKYVTRTLQEHLTALFKELFKDRKKGGVTIQIETSYSYTFNKPPNKKVPLLIPILIPILMQPPLICAIDKLETAMLSKLATPITGWFKPPKPENGEIRLKVTIMSNLTTQSMPVLSLTNLTLAREYIEDLVSS